MKLVNKIIDSVKQTASKYADAVKTHPVTVATIAVGVVAVVLNSIMAMSAGLALLALLGLEESTEGELRLADDVLKKGVPPMVVGVIAGIAIDSSFLVFIAPMIGVALVVAIKDENPLKRANKNTKALIRRLMKNKVTQKEEVAEAVNPSEEKAE